MSSAAALTESARYWPSGRPEDRVRSNTHCTGEPTAARSGSPVTGRSRRRCTLRIGDRPSREAWAGSKPASAGRTAAAASGGVATTTASAASDPRSVCTTTPPSLPRTARTRSPHRTVPPAARTAAAAGSPCRRESGTSDQPMSPASRDSSSPLRTTFAASASDEASAGAFSVATVTSSQSRSTAASPWPWARSHAPNDCRSTSGSSGSSRPSARAARTAPPRWYAGSRR
jgi:hypothetical protein